MDGVILGIDPGTRKSGYAIVAPAGTVIERGIEEIGAIVAVARRLAEQHRIEAIALGGGTNAGPFRTALEALAVPIHIVNEQGTTLAARALYFADYPPRGWKRLVPIGLQLPPRPIDDYAAVLIAQRFLGLPR